MDFGKLANVDNLSLKLADEDARNTKILKARTVPAHIYIGCPVWVCKGWYGKVYPKDARNDELLSFYAKQFNSIELNTTHYRIPDAATVTKWNESVPADFKFSPKFPQIISHEKHLKNVEAESLAFCKALQGLGPKLGLSLLQLPPSFEVSHIQLLRNFLLKIPRSFHLAVEFRHPSCFENRAITPRLFDLLAEFEAAAVITDTAGRRDVVHSSLTAPRSMIRFLGNKLHASDYTRLDEWAERAALWIKNGLEELYIFMHQADEVQAPELARYLADALKKRCGVEVRSWSALEGETQLALF